MPSHFPGYTGQAVQPSQAMQAPVPTAEQKHASMMQMFQDAPNDVLQMIARILKQPGGDAGQGQQPQQPQDWQRQYQMPPPPPFGGINSAMPMRPTQPPQEMNYQPNPGFIRG